MRSFVTSSLPVCVSPCSDQMTGNVLRMDSTLGRQARQPPSATGPGPVADFSVCRRPAVIKVFEA